MLSITDAKLSLDAQDDGLVEVKLTFVVAYEPEGLYVWGRASIDLVGVDGAEPGFAYRPIDPRRALFPTPGQYGDLSAAINQPARRFPEAPFDTQLPDLFNTRLLFESRQQVRLRTTVPRSELTEDEFGIDELAAKITASVQLATVNPQRDPFGGSSPQPQAPIETLTRFSNTARLPK